METVQQAQKRLGRRIKDLRKRLRESQETIAGRAEVATSFFATVEKGGNASVESLVKIANALGVSLTELIAGEELDKFADLERILKGMPASMRVLVLKIFADIASVVRETERNVKARYER